MRGEFKKAEDGSVMVEFALSLPILALLMWGVVELGRAYSQFPVNSRISYELARHGSRLVALTPQSVQSSGSASHQQLQSWASSTLMQSYLLLPQSHAYVNSNTAYWNFQSGYDQATDMVTVDFNSHLLSLFAQLFPLKHESVGPYLFQNNSTIAPTFVTIGSWDCGLSSGASSASPCLYSYTPF